MRLLKYLLPICVVTMSGAYAQDRRAGQESRAEEHLRQRDDILVRDFVQTKENIELEHKKENLEISGDVRFEYRNLHEDGEAIFISDNRFREKCTSLRGGDAIDFRGLPVSNNDWDVEFNLKVKYNFDRAWAAAHLQFDNSAGLRGRNQCEEGIVLLSLDEFTSFSDSSFSSGSSSEDAIIILRNQREAYKGSGESSNINLKRAYMGYTLLADGVHRLDIEIGRRKMDDLFVSEIEFSSRFDGLIFKYATAVEKTFDFYWNIGGFIIDERVNHFGWASEFGFLNIYESGLDLRYSFIDWRKRGENRCFLRNPLGTDFMVSQISFAYNYEMPWGCDCDGKNITIPAELYGGFLINHAARKTIFTKHKRANLGGYMGLYIGDVDKKGDWALDLECFAVQAQAVSDHDVGGICRGNILDESLYDILIGTNGELGDIRGNAFLDINSESAQLTSESLSLVSSSSSLSSSISSSDEFNVFLPRRGNTNWYGYRAEFLYAITDNLSLDTEYEVSWALDTDIGGCHFYSNFEVEFIYAF